MEDLISTYGYFAVLIGTLFEGEIVLVLAGFAASQGYLQLPLVMLAAFVGAFAGDQFWFHLARRHGPAWVERRPRLARRIDRLTAWIGRNPTAVVLGFRFVYGIRTIAPIAIALGGVSPRRFALLNAAGAALWAIIGASAGFAFGHAIEAVLGDLRQVEEALIAGAALILLLATGWRRFNRRLIKQSGSGRSAQGPG